MSYFSDIFLPEVLPAVSPEEKVSGDDSCSVLIRAVTLALPAASSPAKDADRTVRAAFGAVPVTVGHPSHRPDMPAADPIVIIACGRTPTFPSPWLPALKGTRDASRLNPPGGPVKTSKAIAAFVSGW
jgi:hypothetical protein